MSRYKAYPEYEKSKLQWVDRTPKHWDSVHLRWIAKLYAGGTPSKAIEEYWENGSVPWINSGEVNQGLISEVSTYITEAAYKNSSAKWIPKNALVMALAGQGKTKGMIAQLAIDATCNQSMAAIVPQDLQSSRYLFWWLHSNYQNIRNMAGGDLRDGLNLELLGDIGCPIPTAEEQLSIAAFLDHETAKIDALIEKQQRLIELLKEKRQAVISHAVTKGLDPNAPMKDSGVEWLGEVPAHWDLRPLKHLCSFSGGGTPSKDNLSYWSEGNIPWVSPKDMKSFWINDSQDKITQAAVQGSSTNFVNAGALLIVVRSGILQRTIPIAINTVPVTLNQDMKALSFIEEMNVEFAANFILGNIPPLLLEWSKEGATVESIEHEYLSSSVFPVPPYEEQLGINVTIRKRMESFDALEQQASTGISLLQERRTALISAAVTGKIDVRDWQAAA